MEPSVPSCVCANDLSFKICVQAIKSLTELNLGWCAIAKAGLREIEDCSKTPHCRHVHYGPHYKRLLLKQSSLVPRLSVGRERESLVHTVCACV